MGDRLNIPSGGWVRVGDGRKALVLRNRGDALYPNLQVQELFQAPPNPPTREQGSDRPPRTIFGGRRSALEQTDWHELAEHRFAVEIAEALESLHREEPIESLVVVAPARTLADLRQALPKELKRAVIAEVNKDLTKHPVYEIERHLTG